MQPLFYRRSARFFRVPFALWMLAVLALLSVPHAFAAPNPDMAIPPTRTVPNSFQPVAVILPRGLDRPPVPRPKPESPATPRPINGKALWNRALSAYRTHDYSRAFTLFATAEKRSDIRQDPWNHSAAAFWASRAAKHLNNEKNTYEYRMIAAQYKHTFYGQVAYTELGLVPYLSWDTPELTPQTLSLLKSNPAWKKIITDIRAGSFSNADITLQNLVFNSHADAALRDAAFSFSIHYRLPRTALRLAPEIEYRTGIRYDSAYYPVVNEVQGTSSHIDPALIHAIIRQESSFNPQARSTMGAVGLMQLLPSTAQYIQKIYAPVPPKKIHLDQSRTNIDLGKKYLSYLMDRPSVSNDVFNLLIAYNAGPGNLIRWKQDLGDVSDDPLLFIETIPSSETRTYVKKVMAAYWIYRHRFGMNNPTLDKIAGRPAEGHLYPHSIWLKTLKAYLFTSQTSL